VNPAPIDGVITRSNKYPFGSRTGVDPVAPSGPRDPGYRARASSAVSSSTIGAESCSSNKRKFVPRVGRLLSPISHVRLLETKASAVSGVTTAASAALAASGSSGCGGPAKPQHVGSGGMITSSETAGARDQIGDLVAGANHTGSVDDRSFDTPSVCLTPEERPTHRIGGFATGMSIQ
jgi:hypothetical protein